jgi:glycosyltransferase involved in cell wall biosynthesis
MSTKKILLISPTPTHPPTAGNRTRIDALLSGLKQCGHEVYFCHIQNERGDEAAMKRRWGDKYIAVPYNRPRSALARWKKWISALFDKAARYTYAIDDWYDPSIDAKVTSLHERLKFDVVVVEYVFFSKVLQLFGDDVLKIIDTHDVFTDRYKSYLKNGQVPRWFSTTRNGEAKGLNRADIVVAITDKERDFFAGLTAKRVITVGHTVALSEPARPEDLEQHLLFVASDNPINTGGINQFIAKSFPAIRARVPEVKLVLAGSVCKGVADHPGVVKLGRIEDLGPVYQAAAVVINPVLFNTGLSIKNLEALGYARPLITAPVGVDGLEDGAGTAFLVAADDEEFGRHAVRLLLDPDFAGRLARHARDYAAERNRNIIRQLEAILA